MNSNKNVLRVASWDEYIDMGGSVYEGDDLDLLDFKAWYKELTGIDLDNTRPLYEEFEDWYEDVYKEEITVEYIALQDNETMYNQIKMGDTYDLLCPSEYMIMKLAAEDKLKPFPQSFFDVEEEHNYFAKNLSPYIKQVFENGKLSNGRSWAEYAAGYMWGSTGFVFNPEKIDRTIMQSWNCVTNKVCERKITAKDNVRDSYFMGLGMYYEKDLLALKELYKQGTITQQEYTSTLSTYMNDTSVETMGKVKKELEKMRKNLYGLETDEGKLEVIAGRLDASFQWSGDAVFIIDEAEVNDLALEYSIPESASNLWFDGWVMMKDANEHAATAFINFLSMPQNVVRNMYYIGYTSCIAGEEVFDYINETYSDEEGETLYDLSYFFGDGHMLITSAEQTKRQLFAQYPDVKTIDRLVVMEYFDSKTNERANRMWNNIK